ARRALQLPLAVHAGDYAARGGVVGGCGAGTTDGFAAYVARAPNGLMPSPRYGLVPPRAALVLRGRAASSSMFGSGTAPLLCSRSAGHLYPFRQTCFLCRSALCILPPTKQATAVLFECPRGRGSCRHFDNP